MQPSSTAAIKNYAQLINKIARLAATNIEEAKSELCLQLYQQAEKLSPNIQYDALLGYTPIVFAITRLHSSSLLKFILPKLLDIYSTQIDWQATVIIEDAQPLDTLSFMVRHLIPEQLRIITQLDKEGVLSFSLPQCRNALFLQPYQTDSTKVWHKHIASKMQNELKEMYNLSDTALFDFYTSLLAKDDGPYMSEFLAYVRQLPCDLRYDRKIDYPHLLAALPEQNVGAAATIVSSPITLYHELETINITEISTHTSIFLEHMLAHYPILEAQDIKIFARCYKFLAPAIIDGNFQVCRDTLLQTCKVLAQHINHPNFANIITAINQQLTVDGQALQILPENPEFYANSNFSSQDLLAAIIKVDPIKNSLLLHLDPIAKTQAQMLNGKVDLLPILAQFAYTSATSGQHKVEYFMLLHPNDYHKLKEEIGIQQKIGEVINYNALLDLAAKLKLNSIIPFLLQQVGYLDPVTSITLLRNYITPIEDTSAEIDCLNNDVDPVIMSNIIITLSIELSELLVSDLLDIIIHNNINEAVGKELVAAQCMKLLQHPSLDLSNVLLAALKKYHTDDPWSQNLILLYLNNLDPSGLRKIAVTDALFHFLVDYNTTNQFSSLYNLLHQKIDLFSLLSRPLTSSLVAPLTMQETLFSYIVKKHFQDSSIMGIISQPTIINFWVTEHEYSGFVHYSNIEEELAMLAPYLRFDQTLLHEVKHLLEDLSHCPNIAAIHEYILSCSNQPYWQAETLMLLETLEYAKSHHFHYES